MKTTYLKRAEMRRGLVCLVPREGVDGVACHEKTICDCRVIELLDDLDAQESELTKLRKRVEVLEEALSFYGNPESWIIRDKHAWRKSSPRSHGDDENILDYHHPNRDWVGTVAVGGKRAREALKRSRELGEK